MFYNKSVENMSDDEHKLIGVCTHVSDQTGT